MLSSRAVAAGNVCHTQSRSLSPLPHTGGGPGIQSNASMVNGCVVYWLVNADGIITTNADIVTNCRVDSVGTGTPYVWVAGTVAKGNSGYTTSASDGDGDDVITLNSETGLLTTKSLTTLAGSSYLLTLNNSLITFTTRLSVTVGRGPGLSQGFPQLLDVQIGSGQAFIRILNQDLGTGAFNGPVNVYFAVDN